MEESLPEWPDPDKLLFRKVNREWSQEELFEQDGWFSLADVVALLDPGETGKYRTILNQREKLINIGGDVPKIMGVEQFGKGFWANMTVFSRWYRQDEAFVRKRIPKNWNLGKPELNRVNTPAADREGSTHTGFQPIVPQE